MWIDKSEDQDPYNRQSNNLASPNNQPSVGAGAGAPSGSAPAGSNPSTVNPVQQSQPTQQFANVQDYLKGNQQQGEALTSQFTNNLSQSANKEQGAITDAAQNTKNDINSGTVNYNSGLVSEAKNTPTTVANDPGKLNSFLSQWNAAYTGPKSFESSTTYAHAAQAATEAKQNAAQVEDTGGREQMLQDQFGVYGQGNKGLDQALIQNSSQFGNVQSFAPKFRGVTDYLAQKAGDVNAAASNAQVATDATKQQTQGAFTNSLSNFQKDLNSRVASTQATAATQAAQVKADLASGDASKLQADLKNSSLTPAQQASITDYLSALNNDYGKNIDLSSAYTYNPNTDVNAANVATSQDYANAQALQKLTGVDYSGVLNPADASKAGTYATGANALNGTNIDAGLRNALIQSEIEKLNPQTGPQGSSASGSSGKSLGDYLKGGAALAMPGVAGAAFTGRALSQGLNNIGNAVSKALFGGSHKDATVNLPQFQMPDMGVPANANAATMEKIVEVFNKPLSTAGSYHEGVVGDLVQRISTLQTAHAQGQLSDQEYANLSNPLIQYAQKAASTIMSAGSKAANSVTPGYNQLQQLIPHKMKAQ